MSDQHLSGMRVAHVTDSPTPEPELHPQWEETHGHALNEADAATGNYEPVEVQGTVKIGQPQHASYRTQVISTSVNPYRRILPRDDSRNRAVIYSVDQDIVLCESEAMAMDVAANQANNVPYPDGFYLPKGTFMTVYNHTACWAAATSATATRVSTLIERG